MGRSYFVTAGVAASASGELLCATWRTYCVSGLESGRTGICCNLQQVPGCRYVSSCCLLMAVSPGLGNSGAEIACALHIARSTLKLVNQADRQSCAAGNDDRRGSRRRGGNHRSTSDACETRPCPAAKMRKVPRAGLRSREGTSSHAPKIRRV